MFIVYLSLFEGLSLKDIGGLMHTTPAYIRIVMNEVKDPENMPETPFRHFVQQLNKCKAQSN
jgi:hypothetical protein